MRGKKAKQLRRLVREMRPDDSNRSNRFYKNIAKETMRDMKKENLHV